MTDIDGKFTITLKPEDTYLTISYMGYSSRQVSVSREQSAAITVTLDEDLQEMDRVIVVGYSTARKKDITTAISSISEEALADRSITRLEEAFQGTAAGVDATGYSDAPGDGLSVRIRDTSSINAGSAPLYIVDGVQMDELENLNPEDVESIQMLKDASSSAVYGARASNGVVLISTRRGEVGKNKVTYSGYVTVQQLPNRIDVLDSDQYAELIGDALSNAGMSPIDLSAYKDPVTGAFYHNTDWQNKIYGTGFKQNHTISLSGGTAANTYYTSLNYHKHDGIISPSGFERVTFRLNQELSLLPRIKLGTHILASYTDTDRVKASQNKNNGVIALALVTPPFIAERNADGTYGENPFDSKPNPVAQAEAEKDIRKRAKIMGNLYLNWNLMENLFYKVSATVDYNRTNNRYFLDAYSTDWGRTLGGQAIEEFSERLNMTVENTFNYTKTIRRHSIGAMLGHQAQLTGTNYLAGETRGMPHANVTTLNSGALKVNATSSREQIALLSYFASVSYAYDDKYYLTMNARADGSSRFHSDNYWGFFPSVSAAWRVSDEPFLRDVKFLYD